MIKCLVGGGLVVGVVVFLWWVFAYSHPFKKPKPKKPQPEHW